MLKKVKKICIFIAIFIISVYATEYMLRYFHYEELEPNITMYDPSLILRVKPNLNYMHETSEYRVTIKTDSIGCRLSESPQIENYASKIMFIGDSFTFGQGVEGSDTFPALLEKMINKKEHRCKVKVLNCSAPGWCTYQELAFLDEFGFDLKPDLIALVIFMRNDFEENGRFKRCLNKGLLNGQNKKIRNIRKVNQSIISCATLYNKYLPRDLRLTRVPNLLSQAMYRAFLLTVDADYFNSFDRSQNNTKRKETFENEMTIMAIKDFYNSASKYKANIVFILLDPSLDLNNKEDRRVMDQRDLLLEFFKNHEYPYIDLISEIKKSNSDLLGLPSFSVDRHLHPEGQRIIADAIFNNDLFKKLAGINN